MTSTILSTFGCVTRFNFKFPYTSAVDTPICGFAKITQQEGGVFICSIFSPLPVAIAVPPYTQNDTSDPISAPSSANSSIVSPKFHNLLRPRNVAASLLPPANPAATGIVFQ